jgi:hypothetical protein
VAGRGLGAIEAFESVEMKMDEGHSADPPARKWRFTTGQLFLKVAIVAGFLPLLALFGENHVAIALAVLVLLVFAVYELRDPPEGLTELPRMTRFSFAVSRIAFAYAIALCVSLLAWFIVGEPPRRPLPPPPTSVLGKLWYFFSGKFKSDLGEGIGAALAHSMRIGVHLSLMALLSSISCVGAIVALRRYKKAQWLAMLNVPGLVVVVIALSSAIISTAYQWITKG